MSEFQLYKGFAGLIDVTGADRQQKVTGLRKAAQTIGHIGERMAVNGIGNLLHQIPRRNTDGVGFAGGVDLRENGDIHLLQNVYEIIKEGSGSGVGVGLESADDALVAKGLDRSQQRLQLTGEQPKLSLTRRHIVVLGLMFAVAIAAVIVYYTYFYA